MQQIPSKSQGNLNENLEKLAISFSSWIGSVSSLIVHTVAFVVSFSLVLFGVPLDRVLLVLTTGLSLEAIYLAIFIQMTVNRQSITIANVEKDIDEIQEDVEEISHDEEVIAEDVQEIDEDVEEIAEDVEEMQEDIDEIQEDVEDIQEDHSPKTKTVQL